MSQVLVVACVAAAASLLPRVGEVGLSGVGSAEAGAEAVSGPQEWWLRRYRWLLAPAVGAGAWVLLGGTVGMVAAVGCTAICWRMIGRAEPESARRRREAVGRDLPVLVHLVAIGLRAGVDPVSALVTATAALPGPATEELGPLIAPHRLGVDPDRLWAGVAAVPGLEPLGRTLARAGESGASVVSVIDRLAVEVGRDQRATVEDRARQVGVKAAVPLGVCLLPAFLLVGIVPVVGGLVGSLGL
jgi:Flp pilus assembly protein TadB